MAKAKAKNVQAVPTELDLKYPKLLKTAKVLEVFGVIVFVLMIVVAVVVSVAMLFTGTESAGGRIAAAGMAIVVVVMYTIMGWVTMLIFQAIAGIIRTTIQTELNTRK